MPTNIESIRYDIPQPSTGQRMMSAFGSLLGGAGAGFLQGKVDQRKAEKEDARVAFQTLAQMKMLKPAKEGEQGAFEYNKQWWKPTASQDPSDEYTRLLTQKLAIELGITDPNEIALLNKAAEDAAINLMRNNPLYQMDPMSVSNQELYKDYTRFLFDQSMERYKARGSFNTSGGGNEDNEPPPPPPESASFNVGRGLRSLANQYVAPFNMAADIFNPTQPLSYPAAMVPFMMPIGSHGLVPELRKSAADIKRGFTTQPTSSYKVIGEKK